MTFIAGELVNTGGDSIGGVHFSDREVARKVVALLDKRLNITFEPWEPRLTGVDAAQFCRICDLALASDDEVVLADERKVILDLLLEARKALFEGSL